MWKAFIAWLKGLFGSTAQETEVQVSFSGALPDSVDERDQIFNHQLEEK